ncbi:unnamed protein product, partial [Iphiclides podalirius]
MMYRVVELGSNCAGKWPRLEPTRVVPRREPDERRRRSRFDLSVDGSIPRALAVRLCLRLWVTLPRVCPIVPRPVRDYPGYQRISWTRAGSLREAIVPRQKPKITIEIGPRCAEAPTVLSEALAAGMEPLSENGLCLSELELHGGHLHESVAASVGSAISSLMAPLHQRAPARAPPPRPATPPRAAGEAQV